MRMTSTENTICIYLNLVAQFLLGKPLAGDLVYQQRELVRPCFNLLFTWSLLEQTHLSVKFNNLPRNSIDSVGAGAVLVVDGDDQDTMAGPLSTQSSILHSVCSQAMGEHDHWNLSGLKLF